MKPAKWLIFCMAAVLLTAAMSAKPHKENSMKKAPIDTIFSQG